MRFIVFGAGMMGRAIAFDLARSPGVEEVAVADMDDAKARSVALWLKRHADNAAIRPLQLDVAYYDDVVSAMDEVDVAIGAVSYTSNYLLSEAAIEAGVHFLDLGGNNDVVDRQLGLDEKARAANVCIIPNCGLAPGLANILAVSGAKRFETVDEIHLRVGGLPQHPRPPLNYQLVFSAEGLLNEYLEPAEVVRDGKIVKVESMTEIEEISFPPPFGELEAFHTSGGLSVLGRRFEGKARNMDYKTIRYKGHCEKFKLLLDVGFGSSEPIMIGDQIWTAREIFTDLLTKKLSGSDPDAVLLRVTITGIAGGARCTLAYEMVDYYDDTNGITAMMRTTSYPTSIIAQMIARGEIASHGTMPPEECVPAQPLVEELRRRNIIIQENLT
jgi:lysine 6-dehydrogenase